MMMATLAGAIALLAFVVRQARLRVDTDGVRWGYTAIGFRLRRDALRVARVYTDAIALVPQRGFTSWYLGRRDWDRFDDVVKAFKRAGLPVEDMARGAPLYGKLQIYGLALDALYVLDIVAISLVALIL
jgi:hypothetical protein